MPSGEEGERWSKGNLTWGSIKKTGEWSFGPRLGVGWGFGGKGVGLILYFGFVCLG